MYGPNEKPKNLLPPHALLIGRSTCLHSLFASLHMAAAAAICLLHTSVPWFRSGLLHLPTRRLWFVSGFTNNCWTCFYGPIPQNSRSIPYSLVLPYRSPHTHTHTHYWAMEVFLFALVSFFVSPCLYNHTHAPHSFTFRYDLFRVTH